MRTLDETSYKRAISFINGFLYDIECCSINYSVPLNIISHFLNHNMIILFKMNSLEIV